jgi:predicted DNA-binding transcriptional regulator AlpA
MRAQKLYLNPHESEMVLENILGISFTCPKVKIFLLVNANVKNKGEFIMREAVVKSYEELPLFLNAQMIANVLGISISSAYELLHEEGFPSLRIGNRVVDPKDYFRQWVEDHIVK